MKKKFIFGMYLAPIVIAGFWAVKALTAPGITVNPEERKEILEGINYIQASNQQISPSLSFHVHYNKNELKESKLSDFKGKPTIVHVWATWCGPCQKELPGFNKFSAKYKKHFNILAISADMAEKVEEAKEKVTTFCKQAGYNDICLAFDHKADFVRALGLQGVPTTIFYDKEGKEIGRINGATFWDDPKVELVIKSLLV